MSHQDPLSELPRKFPTVIDNSLREAYSLCRRKGFYTGFLNKEPKARSIHLHAGGAFAKGMEVARKAYFVRGLPPRDAVTAGIMAMWKFYGDFPYDAKPLKGPLPLTDAFVGYFKQYPFGVDRLEPALLPNGSYGIEFTFAVPLPIANPDTGDPILYGGRFDMLGVNSQKQMWVVDEKTTSALGPKWGRQWEMSSQFTGYCWAANQYGLHVIGATIRGISLLKNTNGFVEVPLYRPPWVVERWYEQLLRDVTDMVRRYQDNDWNEYALNHACNAYNSQCPFQVLCATRQPLVWLQSEFQERTWNPLKVTDDDE